MSDGSGDGAAGPAAARQPHPGERGADGGEREGHADREPEPAERQPRCGRCVRRSGRLGPPLGRRCCGAPLSRRRGAERWRRPSPSDRWCQGGRGRSLVPEQAQRVDVAPSIAHEAHAEGQVRRALVPAAGRAHGAEWVAGAQARPAAGGDPVEVQVGDDVRAARRRDRPPRRADGPREPDPARTRRDHGCAGGGAEVDSAALAPRERSPRVVRELCEHPAVDRPYPRRPSGGGGCRQQQRNADQRRAH